jgi:hypothetical protein
MSGIPPSLPLLSCTAAINDWIHNGKYRGRSLNTNGVIRTIVSMTLQSMNQKDELNVSLEPHLLEVLNPLPTILPDDLAAELSTFVSPPSSLIPHSTLLKISTWSRSPAGLEALKSSSLDPQSYSMISLLAGTRTSPEKKFPAYMAKDPEAERKQAADDRKAVSTVVNGIFSVAGTGVATWWASEYTGLRLEWV